MNKITSKNNPLVSVIITTRNEEKNIKNILDSILSQTYKNIEIIVVDNNSTDKTKEIVSSVIARSKATKQSQITFFNKGPERSAQRNFGAKKSKGDYLLFLDADMLLTPKVISSCVNLVQSYKVRKVHQVLDAVIIPEKSFGEGFWAQCKALERSFYIGVDWMEAARFYSKKAFEGVGGYLEDMISGEDWDLSQRVKEKYTIGRISEFILHNEGNLSLQKELSKKYYYAKKIKTYLNANKGKKQISQQVSPLSRYALFFSDSKKLFKNKSLAFGMLFLKFAEYFAGGIGYLWG